MQSESQGWLTSFFLHAALGTRYTRDLWSSYLETVKRFRRSRCASEYRQLNIRKQHDGTSPAPLEHGDGGYKQLPNMHTPWQYRALMSIPPPRSLRKLLHALKGGEEYQYIGWAFGTPSTALERRFCMTKWGLYESSGSS